MSQQVFRNAQIVLPDEVVHGSLTIRDGRIADIAPGASDIGEDLGGDLLIPGLVELHTDHIEGHYLPRPKVRWNMMAALQAHDAQIAASGITTVFDALRVGMDEDALLGSDDMLVHGRHDRRSGDPGSPAGRPLHPPALRGFGPRRPRDFRVDR